MIEKKYEYEYKIGVSSNTSIDPISMIKYMKDHISVIKDKHNELEITVLKLMKKHN